MFLQQKKSMFLPTILTVFLLLVAWSLAACTSNSTQNQTSTSPTSTPQLIIPKAAGGSAGQGPIVISSPTPAPGGNPGTQQIALRDRTLIIQSVTRQKEATGNSTLISLSLIIHNTGNTPIQNQSTFFKLVGSQGDIFTYQSNSSDNFYGLIPAHTTRTGTIVFPVPPAALAGLHLLYRPEVATESALVLLQVA